MNQPVQVSWIFNDCFIMIDGKNIISKLQSLKETPTAILTNGDEVAAGMISEAKSVGLKIPNEISIIGLDNNPMSEGLALTTLDSNIKEIGKQSFQLFYTNYDEQIIIITNRIPGMPFITLTKQSK